MARVVGVTPASKSTNNPGSEVVEEETPKVRKKLAVVAVEEDGEGVVDRPKKKKKRNRPAFDEEENASANQAWWIVPVSLIVVGLILSLIGSVGFASKSKDSAGAIGAGIMVAIALVQLLISIPITIVALIVGGKLFSIEYGSPMMAITNIAAIGSMMIGLDWFLSWAGLWPTAIFCITFIAGFSLFMTLFQLDSWEVWVSLFCIKAVTFASYLIVFVVIIAALVRGGKGFDDFVPDDRPNMKQNGNGNLNNNQDRNRGGGDPDEEN